MKRISSELIFHCKMVSAYLLPECRLRLKFERRAWGLSISLLWISVHIAGLLMAPPVTIERDISAGQLRDFYTSIGKTPAESDRIIESRIIDAIVKANYDVH